MFSPANDYYDNNVWWASCLVLLICIVGYWFSTATYAHWKKLNVPYVQPVIPLFGNFGQVALGKLHPVEFYEKMYRELDGHRYGGLFQMRTPYLMIRDPELITKILIKDFSYFSDRGFYSDLSANPLSNNLFFMNNPKWKVMRNKLAPAFSPSKIKLIYDQITSCTDELIKNINGQITAADEESGTTIDIREVMIKYTTEVIGIWAFGIKLNTLSDAYCNFRKYGKAINAPSLRILLRELCLMISPMLLKVIRLKDFPSDANSFFYSVIHETIQYREKNNVVRKDLVQVLMEARNDLVLNENLSPNEKFTETDIVANAFIMFAGGFETISNTVGSFLYEIALNKNIQDKLREELLSKLSKHNGKINNELLMDINYLDMVLAETLRKYPLFFGLFRKATKTYHVPNESLIIEKGQQIIIPTRSLHFDPKYFENPNVFDPERFSPENKVKIINGTYLPFGDGGRICIGKRFAELEIKLALVEILTKFEVAPCKKTEIPLSYSKMTFISHPKNGIWLAFKKITI